MRDNLLNNFDKDLKIVVFGATGGLGKSFIAMLAEQENVKEIYAVSRRKIGESEAIENQKINYVLCDMTSESSLSSLATEIGEIDIIIIATGLLHNDRVKPEKSIKDINLEQFQQLFTVNLFIPTLIAKIFLPKLKREQKTIFAALSARVGSITDNYLGGWYAYRASKAALNMTLKNLAIEVGRKNKNACIIGLHPGTVSTELSRPYLSGSAQSKVFTPDHAVSKMLTVINNLTPDDSGNFYAYDGSKIPF